MTNEELKDMMSRCTTEYIKERGYITTEFSAKADQVLYIHDLIPEFNKQLSDSGLKIIDNAHWRLFKCSTCISHSETNHYHVEIFNF